MLSASLYPLTCVCGNVKIHCTHMYLHTSCSSVFRRYGILCYILLQVRHHCSPVRQVLLTGSVNINKTSFPSVPTPAVARLAAMQMRALRKQPVKPCAWPASTACQPADRWAQRGQVWLQAVCTLWMIKRQMYGQQCAALIKKKLGSKAVME